MMEESPSTTVETVQDSTVSIGRSEFETLMRRLNTLETQGKDAISTDSSFKRYSGPRAYSFKTIDNKPISSLKLTSNIIKKNLSTGGWNEDQRMMVTYGDGTTEEMTYDDYVQSYVPSEKYFPVREEHNVKVYFKDSTRKPIVVSAGEYKTTYTTLTPEGVEVTNHDIVKKCENQDKITFQIDEQDEEGKYLFMDGKEFTVDNTAFN